MHKAYVGIPGLSKEAVKGYLESKKLIVRKVDEQTAFESQAGGSEACFVNVMLCSAVRMKTTVHPEQGELFKKVHIY